jgi:imidazolonepropionase-like amidohydrolase
MESSEFQAMVKAGLSPLHALKAVTSIASETARPW